MIVLTLGVAHEVHQMDVVGLVRLVSKCPLCRCRRRERTRKTPLVSIFVNKNRNMNETNFKDCWRHTKGNKISLGEYYMENRRPGFINFIHHIWRFSCFYIKMNHHFRSSSHATRTPGPPATAQAAMARASTGANFLTLNFTKDNNRTDTWSSARGSSSPMPSLPKTAKASYEKTSQTKTYQGLNIGRRMCFQRI